VTATAKDVIGLLNHPDLRERIPGEIIFRGLGGSHSYGVANADSDFDLKFVFVQPTRDFLGLESSLRDTFDGKIELDGVECDFVAYEVRKFAGLLLKGNPNIVEFLYFPADLYEAGFSGGEWDRLVKHRKMFLTQEAVKQYIGYAAGQMHRLKNKLEGKEGSSSLHTTGGDYNAKWAYHMVRLMWEVGLIADGAEPQVRWTGPMRDTLLEVREGKWTPEEILKHTRMKLDAVYAKDLSALPEKGDVADLDAWVREVRMKNGGSF
jgi:predicted nucleotidyltransferase